MGTSKKSVVGHAEVFQLSGGEKEKIGKDFFVKIAESFLHEMIENKN